MTRMVLFGAGASYGSSTPPGIGVPPLGAHLFDALEARGGIAATLSDDLKAIFRRDFEQGMWEYYKSVETNVLRFQQELALYLLEFRIAPDSQYLRLLQLINPDRHIFCSLNYDLLLELAFTRCTGEYLGRKFWYATKVQDDVLRILKPHGSCNFWPDLHGNIIVNPQVRNFPITETGRADIEADVQILTPSDALKRCREDVGIPPAIAIFGPGKVAPVCPRFILHQQEMYTEAVMAASKICIVGARINDPDKHIWEPLAASRADIRYFGLDADQPSFDAWKAKTRRKNIYFESADFATAVPSIARHLEGT